MADLDKTIKGLECCSIAICPQILDYGKSDTGCPYHAEENCVELLAKDAHELLKEQKNLIDELIKDQLKKDEEQQAEIERLKDEKNRVIEQIEREIHLLFKERECVKDDVGIAQYQWLINGYQSALDMIKDGEQE